MLREQWLNCQIADFYLDVSFTLREYIKIFFQPNCIELKNQFNNNVIAINYYSLHLLNENKKKNDLSLSVSSNISYFFSD